MSEPESPVKKFVRLPVTQVVAQEVQQGRSRKWVAKAYREDGSSYSGWNGDREYVARKVEESWPGVPVRWEPSVVRVPAGVDPSFVAGVAALTPEVEIAGFECRACGTVTKRLPRRCATCAKNARAS